MGAHRRTPPTLPLRMRPRKVLLPSLVVRVNAGAVRGDTSAMLPLRARSSSDGRLLSSGSGLAAVDRLLLRRRTLRGGASSTFSSRRAAAGSAPASASSRGRAPSASPGPARAGARATRAATARARSSACGHRRTTRAGARAARRRRWTSTRPRGGFGTRTSCVRGQRRMRGQPRGCGVPWLVVVVVGRERAKGRACGRRGRCFYQGNWTRGDDAAWSVGAAAGRNQVGHAVMCGRQRRRALSRARPRPRSRAHAQMYIFSIAHRGIKHRQQGKNNEKAPKGHRIRAGSRRGSS
jgi:hypothetical protein